MNITHSFTSETQLKEILDFIYKKSKEGKSFNGILEAAFNEVTIITAIHNIKSNKGANTPGIDGIRMDRILQMEKGKLIELIQKSIINYKAKPVRRTYIKKANGKLRPLGIPTVIDKIIQECIKIIIEPICEAKFYPQNFGFRPYRATCHAMKYATTLIGLRTQEKPTIAIEGDIEGYFDNINHRILLRKLYRIGIKDKRVLSIIKQMLIAGYVYDNEEVLTDKGTVQGGIISPLLANVYLNDFDWMLGRMYHHPKSHYKNEASARTALKRKGVKPKYLIRYCDDWLIMTTMLSEAIKILKYLQKYYKHRLKLKLSEEKTLITDLTKTRAKFLGYELLAAPPRARPDNKGFKGIVGKFYPDKTKVIAKVDIICKEIYKLRGMTNTKTMAAQIERINSIITGAAEYYKVAICSNTYGYMDNRIKQTAYRTFRKIYGKKYKKHHIPMAKLSNRPQRHEKRQDKTFAVEHNEKWIGITKAYITHSQRDKYNYNQKMTPYSSEGRQLYIIESKGRKIPALDRPPIYEDVELFTCEEKSFNNFEYYMNREYAYNRDRGRCKICGENLRPKFRHCQRLDGTLPLDKINRVPNLAWFCYNCMKIITGGEIPPNINSKMKSKIERYRAKLKVLN
ncbi:UNVERIFIED_CONTAM: group II intron reverse transcriptase/maturase [Acetivibrio alkalicellulosi]